MQATTILAVDFFHVDCAVTLKRIYVFFALEVGHRYVHIQDLLGWSAAIFPAAIIVIDALQLWLAQSAKVRGWLN